MNTISALRNYAEYAKMFSVTNMKTTEELKDAFLLLEAAPVTKETALSKAVIVEVLIERGEEQWYNETIEILDAA